KPTLCWESSQSFSWSSRLMIQQQLHTREKPYKYLKYGKSFSQSSHLIYHQNIHNGKQPYKCLECGKTFSNSSTHHPPE
ncbi:ZN664 protein, partial [Smithornis capensis]|nr:ZN664 protein [Smithornis capensis]